MARDKCIVNVEIEELNLELKELLVICFLLALRQLSFVVEMVLLWSDAVGILIKNEQQKKSNNKQSKEKKKPHQLLVVLI